MKNSLSKERQNQIERFCAIEYAIEQNYTPLKTVDVVYYEKRGWKPILQKVDPKLFDRSRVEHFSEILDTVDTTKIQYCVHNVSAKRYKINQKSKIYRHNFEIELQQELEEQA